MKIRKKLKKFFLDPMLYVVLGTSYIIYGILDRNATEVWVGIFIFWSSLLAHYLAEVRK